MNTKIFCDIADFNQIKKFNKKNIVRGFTTNPSLMRKAGASNYETYCKKILKICKNKPVSFEVFGDNHKSMIDQGLKISTWSKNIYVKVRSTGKLLDAKVNFSDQNNAKVDLVETEDGISPGQACVFYNKDTLGYKVMGGGWIKE